MAPYFVEEVRKELEARYGAKQLYENGLVDADGARRRLQDAANRALDDGLRRIDKRRGFRKPRRNVVAEGHTIDAFQHARWDRPIAVGDIVPAVVTGRRRRRDPSARRRPCASRSTARAIAWTGKTTPARSS